MARYDVCMVVRNHFVGDSRVEKEAAFLASKGLRLKILALARPDLPQKEVFRGFEVVRFSLENIPLSRYKSGPNAGTIRSPLSFRDCVCYVLNVIFFQWVNTVELLKSRPRVIHCHDLSGLQPGYVASKLLRCKLIYDSHELWLRRNIVAKRRFAKYHHIKEKIMEARMIGAAHHVITVSASIAETLSQWYGIRRPTVLVNGVEETVPSQPREIGEQISGSGPICVYVGGRIEGRGLENQVRAIALVPNVRLVMIGSGTPYLDDRLRKLAEESGCSERLFLLPSVPASQLIDWISTADIGLTTIEPRCLSYRFCLPNKIFQYGMAGVPVIASDFPDMGALVREYGLGTLCDPEDPESVARQIKAILDGEVSPMTSKQQETFRSVFSWPAQQKILQDIYTEVGGFEFEATPADSVAGLAER